MHQMLLDQHLIQLSDKVLIFSGLIFPILHLNSDLIYFVREIVFFCIKQIDLILLSIDFVNKHFYGLPETINFGNEYLMVILDLRIHLKYL